MARRTRVNCEICKSFLHSTEEHKKKGEKVWIMQTKELDSKIRKATLDGFKEGIDAGKEELIEQIEKWCKENRFHMAEWVDFPEDEFKENYPDFFVIETKDLLSAIRKGVI